MKTEFLKGLGLSDEQIAAVFAENGKDINAAREKNAAALAELETLRGKLSERDTEISVLKNGQHEAEELKNKIEELQKVVDRRDAEDAEQALCARFEAVTGNVNFVNDFTRTGIMEKFREACLDAANESLSDAEIFASVTADHANLFEPDGGMPSVLSGAGFGFGDTLDDSDVREIMGL